MIGIYGPDTERIAQMYYKRLREWLRVSEEDDKFLGLMATDNEQEGYKEMLDFVYSRIKSGPEKLILVKPEYLKGVAEEFENEFNPCIELYKRTQKKTRGARLSVDSKRVWRIFMTIL